MVSGSSSRTKHHESPGSINAPWAFYLNPETRIGNILDMVRTKTEESVDPGTAQMDIAIDPELKRAFQVACVEQGTSMSAVVRRLARLYLKALNPRSRMELELRAAVKLAARGR